MANFTDEKWTPGAVRIRAKAIDPLEGLRGRDYINARGLGKPQVQRINAGPEALPLLNFVFTSGDINFLKIDNGDRRFFPLLEMKLVQR